MMHRSFQAALFTAAVIVYCALAHGRALAIVEYCGASMNLTPIGVADAASPAATYAIRFSANSPRTASGHVAVQTDNGWYDLAFNDVNLSARTYHYRGLTVLFSRTEFESPTLFATFTSPVIVRAAFVRETTVTNEDVLGWDSQPHACAGYTGDASAPQASRAKDVTLLDPDPVPTPPAPGTPVLRPSISSAPGSTNCTQPFALAKATATFAPQFPVGYHIDGPYETLVEVAVNEKGNLDDAWIFAPSGVRAFDDAAIRSARLSKYQAPRSFCQDVPGVYLFRAVFRP